MIEKLIDSAAPPKPPASQLYWRGKFSKANEPLNRRSSDWQNGGIAFVSIETKVAVTNIRIVFHTHLQNSYVLKMPLIVRLDEPYTVALNRLGGE